MLSKTLLYFNKQGSFLVCIIPAMLTLSIGKTICKTDLFGALKPDDASLMMQIVILSKVSMIPYKILTFLDLTWK